MRSDYRSSTTRLLQPSATAPLRPVFDAAYRVFARNRKPISRTLAPLISAPRARRARRALAEMDRCVGAECTVRSVAGEAARAEPGS